MNGNRLIQNLNSNHQAFVDYINALTKNEFMFQNAGKWTAGQQLDHIYRSVKPLVLVLRLPEFMLKLLFGNANRTSKTYDELVASYHNKLHYGGKATGRFIPANIPFPQKEKLIQSLNKTIKNLTAAMSHYAEEQLDKLILPHPLLGKLTLREMMYFTIYHVSHHLAQCRLNLEADNNKKTDSFNV